MKYLRFATATTVFCFVVETVFFFWSSQPVFAASTYYVSPSGDDSNAGTLESPWRTISKAAKTLTAGDTVYVRGGTYQEVVSVTTSGTASQPIKIAAYPGETPIVDGKSGTLPTNSWGVLFNLIGDYIQASGFEVRYSNWIGVQLKGHHNTVSNFNSHHNNEQGILVKGDNGIVENSRIWWNAARNESGTVYPNGGWATGVSAARDDVDGITNNAIIRKNVIYNNWGEGLSSFEASGTTMEDNIVYDNQLNSYISDSTNVISQRNLIYCTPNNALSKGKQAEWQIGIGMGDETTVLPSKNITIINNMVIGCKINFYSWGGSGLTNSLIAYNTFANSTKETNFKIDSSTRSNTRIFNNIFLQEDTLSVASVDSKNGLEFSHNLWSKNPPSVAVGANDVVANPVLAKTGSLTAGSLTAEWFKLSSTSPAINKATSISDVTTDYFLSSRGSSPDIGAHELTGNETAPAPTPKPGDTNQDNQVDETDYKTWLTNYQKNTSLGVSGGDFDTNGKVDGIDYVIWLTHYGTL